MSLTAVALVVVLFLLVAYLVNLYNGLVRLKHGVSKAWANIDVLLRQRHEELPKLVETCKQYMQHERNTLEAVITARNAVASARDKGDVGALGQAESGLRAGLGQLFAQVKPQVPRWYIEAHQFRIDTAGGVGRPTPEGAHRDGMDFVVVLLVARRGVKGGETRVFDAHGPNGMRFLMQEPLTALLLDDERVIHETTPLYPADGQAPEGGLRDTLVLTYRAGDFQAP